MVESIYLIASTSKIVKSVRFLQGYKFLRLSQEDPAECDLTTIRNSGLTNHIARRFSLLDLVRQMRILIVYNRALMPSSILYHALIVRNLKQIAIWVTHDCFRHICQTRDR